MNIERIARAYCVNMGLDPDAMSSIPCPDGRPGCCVAHYGPMWKRYEYDVRSAIAMRDAMFTGADVLPPPTVDDPNANP